MPAYHLLLPSYRLFTRQREDIRSKRALKGFFSLIIEGFIPVLLFFLSDGFRDFCERITGLSRMSSKRKESSLTITI
jgi:hypothetical protein